MPQPGYSRVKEILSELPTDQAERLNDFLRDRKFTAESIEQALRQSGYQISSSAISTWRRKNLPREETRG